MDIASVMTDPKKEKEGVWFDWNKDEGTAFLIAYQGNKKYKDKLMRIAAAVRRRNRARDLPASLQAEVQVDAMINTVLLDWRGWEKDGQPYEFNDKNAKEWLLNAPEILDFITIESNIVGNFQKNTHGENASAEEGADEELKSSTDVGVKVGE